MEVGVDRALGDSLGADEGAEPVPGADVLEIALLERSVDGQALPPSPDQTVAEGDVDTVFERALRRRMPELEQHAERRTTPLAAVAQIAVAAAVLGAGVGWFYLRGSREQEIEFHLDRARLLARP